MKNMQIIQCNDIYNSVKRMRVEGDMTLPDYCSDISRVIRVDCTPHIRDKKVYVRDGSAVCEVSGDVVNNIVYLTDSGALESVSFDSSFFDSTKTGIDNGDAESIASSVMPMCDNCVCKVQSPRRVNVRCDVSLDMKLCANKGFDACGEESGSVETCRKKAGVMRLLSSANADFKLSEEIKLPKSCPPMERILSVDVTLYPDGVKSGDNSVNFWATAGITCVYLGEDDAGVQSFYQALEVKGDIEVDDSRNDTVAFVSLLVGKCQYEIAPDSLGENRVFKIDLPYTAQCTVLENADVTLTDDIYGVGCKAEAVFDKREFTKYAGTLRESTAIKEKIALKRAVDSVEGATVSVIFKDTYFENGELYTDSRVDFKAIGMSDSQPALISESFEISVHLNLPSEFASVKDKLKLDVSQHSGFCDVRLDAEGVTVAFDIETVAEVFESEELGFVSSVELSECEKEDGESIFCYPSESDSLWSIGKRYGVGLEALANANGISDGRLKRVMKIK